MFAGTFHIRLKLKYDIYKIKLYTARFLDYMPAHDSAVIDISHNINPDLFCGSF